ncbi:MULTISPECIES: immunity protein YezG family protein [unclassified Kribbella]|uniref:immunity protein YezG family protein n=1 Tax=unclassified Kribbella TaxID=2644121 RepID=UPI00340746E3
MTEMTNEMGTIEAIARALTSELPAGWREVRATYRATAPYAELDADVVDAEGNAEQVDPLAEGLEGHFETLRLQMYQQGKGTWLTATISITADGHFTTDFDYESEPAWSMPVDAEIYASDLAEFPREDQYIPDWLREKTQ